MTSARQAPQVTLSHGGTLRGVWLGDVRVFRGVRYARAPVGALRFEAPVAEPPWQGVREAHAFGPPFLQWPRHADEAAGPIGTADALSLNIWAPEAPSGARLPVMVWVHGGGYFRGAASDPLYDGASFARQGLVFVSIQYRLGVDGFAHLPPAPANRGLLDQLAALRWVQDHISCWGGDPAQVSVFGQSAGAGALVCLMGMPASRGLFRRAILQSPSVACQDIEEANAASKAIATLVGVAPTHAAMAAAPVNELLRAVHRLASDARMRKAHGLSSRNFFPLRPVIDGQCLQALPLDALVREWQARRTPLQVLVGHNAEEMRLYHVPDGGLERLTQTDLEDFVRDTGLEMPRGSEGPAAQLCALQSTYYYGDPTDRIADLAATYATSVHRYLFGWRSPRHDAQLGAAHGVELPFVFDSLTSTMGREFAGDAPPRELARRMHQAWGRFAREGDPGWQRHTQQQPSLQTFESPPKRVTSVPDARASLMNL